MNPRSATVRRMLTFGVTMAVVALSGVIGAAPAPAQSGVRLSATVDGVAANTTTASHPLRLRPRRGTELSVTVANAGSSPVRVQQVRLEGRVVGLSFFSYSIATDIAVAPGQSQTRRFQLDLSQLRGQAIGLMPASIAVSGARGDIAHVAAVVDVRGSLRSVYGVFGLTVAILTVMALARALVALARHRLSANRFRRGIDFLVPGVGVGLFLVFTLSAFRIVLPQTAHWLPMLLVAGAAGFGLGYVTPSRDDEDDDIYLSDSDAEAIDDGSADHGAGDRPSRDDGPLITVPSVRHPMSEGS